MHESFPPLPALSGTFAVRIFDAAKQYADQNNLTFNWKIDTIKSVGHEYKKMSESSIQWIKNFR